MREEEKKKVVDDDEWEREKRNWAHIVEVVMGAFLCAEFGFSSWTIHCHLPISTTQLPFVGLSISSTPNILTTLSLFILTVIIHFFNITIHFIHFNN